MDKELQKQIWYSLDRESKEAIYDKIDSWLDDNNSFPAVNIIKTIGVYEIFGEDIFTRRNEKACLALHKSDKLITDSLNQCLEKSSEYLKNKGFS